MHIYERIFLLLGEQNKMQIDLAKYLKVRPSTINGWKQNQRNPPSEHIMSICEFFNVAPEYLLTGRAKENNSEYFEQFTKSDLQTISKYSKLNEAGKDKVDAYIDGLMTSDKFILTEPIEPEIIERA